MVNSVVKIEKKILIFWGAISTMPILTLFGNTWFTYVSLVMGIYYLLKESSKSKLSVKKNFYIIIFVFAIISSIICLVSSMEDYWRNDQYKNIVWEILYLIIFLHFLSSKKNEAIYYIKGIYYASVIQVFWGFLQLVFHFLLRIELNDVLFGELFHMQTRALTQYKGDSIALSGLCWNVGNLGALVCMGYMLTSNPAMKLIFIVFSLLSGSRTLLLGMIVCVFGEFVLLIIGKLKKIKCTKIFLIMAVLIFAALVLAINTSFFELITSKITYLMNAFSSDFLKSQTSARIHSRYWITIGDVTAWSGLLHSLFGWGNGCSGYPFAEIFGQFVGEQWVVECDFINRLWSFGYIGFTLWYGWFAWLIIKSLKIEKKYVVLFVAILIEGITYNVVMGWCYLGLLVFFSFIYKKVNVFDELKIAIKDRRNWII